MKKYNYSDLSDEDINQLCRRPKMDFKSVFGQVEPIIEAIRSAGDEAVLKYTEQFDGIRPDPMVLKPKGQTVAIDLSMQKAIDTAFNNIQQFHEAQLPDPIEVETMPGVTCKRITRPIERVGLYIPCGTAMLPSTLMMLGIPAILAGCKQIIIATPPNKNGKVADQITYIAQKINANIILKAGGAQAVAAMAWGTDLVPKVDKIFGPGNQYVTAAKMLLQNSEAQIAIDMPAGPSEVLVIADETADPGFVAADLLSQAEHGADSQVVLVATAAFNWKECIGAIEKQLEKLPRNKIAKKAMKNSFGIQVESLEQAFDFSNQYAPEHLIIQCKDPEQWQNKIINAGSVFLGAWSPESAGDYASGTNHTLPTYGYARVYSGVSVDSFLKFITVQQLSKEGLKKLGPTIETLAELEKLEGHKRAVSIRLQKIKNE